LVHQLSRRVAKMLERRGLIRDGPVQAAADENEQAALDACRGVSLRRTRFERIDDKGQSQQTPKSKHADKDANESLSTSSTVPDEHDGTFDVMATKPSVQDRDLAPRPSERPPSKIATLGHPIPPGLPSRSRPWATPSNRPPVKVATLDHPPRRAFLQGRDHRNRLDPRNRTRGDPRGLTPTSVLLTGVVGFFVHRRTGGRHGAQTP